MLGFFLCPRAELPTGTDPGFSVTRSSSLCYKQATLELPLWGFIIPTGNTGLPVTLRQGSWHDFFSSLLVSLLFYFPSSNKIKGWFKNIIPQTREILETETLLGEGTFIRQLRELRVINYMLQESGSVSRTLLCVTKQANQGSKRSVIVRPKGSHSPLSAPYCPCNT